MLVNKMEVVSGLAFIKIKENACFLFKEWLEEAKKYQKGPIIMNLATASPTGEVSNRSLVLRDVLSDGGLVIMGHKNGQKYKHIRVNNKVAATFLFCYEQNNQRILRQVRIEGVTEQLPSEICEKYYKSEPIYCKIRGWICHQGETVAWEDIKQAHDKLLKQIQETGVEPEMPPNVLAHKIIPEKMDFYHGFDNYIADRVVFVKDGDDESGNWKHERVFT